MTTKRIPRKALHFSASMDLGDGDTAVVDGVMPARAVTIRARTSGEAFQSFWGRCAHDMDGFIPPTGPVSLNWDHSDDIVGVADSCAVEDGALVAPSRLIPFAPYDSASEIITKGAQGVPYQASIELDASNLWVEEVAAGQTVDVNGGTFTGPGVVFRQWGITGIAILGSGADSDTSVEFAAGKSDVDVTLVVPAAKENPIMDPVVKPDGPSVEERIAEALKAQREEAHRFMTDFGAAGAQWHLEGKSYGDAALLFSTGLKKQLDDQAAAHKTELETRDAKITELQTQLNDLSEKLNFRRGHPTPVPVKPGDDQKKTPAGSPMQRFAAGVASRMPKPANN